MRFPRACGILLHPTSLPGPFGIGDLGSEARRFVDFLNEARQTYWQILPLSPTGYDASPYQSFSAFAGNPMLISPERLVEKGHLPPEALTSVPDLPSGHVDFERATHVKEALLDRAFARFQQRASDQTRGAFHHFCSKQAHWLDDFALFMALRGVHGQKAWHEWPSAIAHREPDAMGRWRQKLKTELRRHQFRQWLFYDQWLALKRYANERGMRIIGDIPIFVSLDSADVWAHPHLFHLDADRKPTIVSGVPPDYFSDTGQLWGHPLYDWETMGERGYTWWISRFRMAFTQADVVRVDHFRGFHNYWAIPAEETTAINGAWRPGPGSDFFHAVTETLGDVAIIAEDLGDFDEEARAGVDALQGTFGYPGMRILQFAFGGGSDNTFLPHHYDQSCVAYTGTHDNDTLVGWYQVSASEHERDHVRRYAACNGSDIAWDVIRLAWRSVADTAMTTAQDLFSLSHEARMNTPGTVGPPNWRWRLVQPLASPDLIQRLRDLTFLYGRGR